MVKPTKNTHVREATMELYRFSRGPGIPRKSVKAFVDFFGDDSEWERRIANCESYSWLYKWRVILNLYPALCTKKWRKENENRARLRLAQIIERLQVVADNLKSWKL